MESKQPIITRKERKRGVLRGFKKEGDKITISYFKSSYFKRNEEPFLKIMREDGKVTMYENYKKTHFWRRKFVLNNDFLNIDVGFHVNDRVNEIITYEFLKIQDSFFSVGKRKVYTVGSPKLSDVEEDHSPLENDVDEMIETFKSHLERFEEDCKKFSKQNSKRRFSEVCSRSHQVCYGPHQVSPNPCQVPGNNLVPPKVCSYHHSRSHSDVCCIN